MAQEKEYFAFISYQRKDEKWAKWLVHELEHYHLPVTLNGRDDLPKDLRPIFRDADELSAGNLPEQIHNALVNSKHLIVVCSPRAAKSEWVNKEIEEFISMGKTDKIFPFIIEGVAMCKDSEDEQECFPPALRNLPKDDERLGANINENGHRSNILTTCDDCPKKRKRIKDYNQGDINEKGRDAAVVKIVAGMLGLNFDTLWQRYEREKVEEERTIREQRDNLLRLQNRYIAEKVDKLLEEGDSYTAIMFSLEALPKNLKNPDRPYVPEVEAALRKSINNENAILKGHTDKVCSVAFSHDGKYIASASWDHTIRLWEVETGITVSILRPQFNDRVFTWVAFGSDGNVIYARHANANFAYSWDVKTKEEIEIYPNGNKRYLCVLPNGIFDNISVRDFMHEELLNHSKHLSVTFDKKLFAILPDELHSPVLIYDLVNNEFIYSLGKDVYCFAFSYDGNMLVTCSTLEIVLWNLSDGSSIQILNTHEDPLFPVSTVFSPDGKSILVTTNNGLINMYSIPNLRLVKKLEGHTSLQCNVANYSPNGKIIVSSSDDTTVRIWNLRKNEPHYTICVNERYFSTSLLVYAPDGEHILSKGNNQDLCMWNLKTGELVHTYRGLSLVNDYAAFSPDGKWLVSCDGIKMIIWYVETEQIMHEINRKDFYKDTDWESLSINKAVFSSDGKQLLINGEKVFTIMDAESWRIVKRVFRYPDISDLDFSYNDKRVVLSMSNYLEVWKEYNDIHRDSNDPDYWLSSDNKRISHVTDSNIRDWYKFKKAYLRQELHGHIDWVDYVICSPCDNLAASASRDTTIRLWDIKEMKELKCLTGHTNEILSIEFSSDGKLLLSASKDLSVRVWDVETGVELYHIKVEEDDQYDELFKASFSPDNKWIATISTPIDADSSMIKIWPYPTLQELINETRERFKNRQLTPEERRKYYLE